jgi:hypothetical protein
MKKAIKSNTTLTRKAQPLVIEPLGHARHVEFTWVAVGCQLRNHRTETGNEDWVVSVSQLDIYDH